MWHPVVWYTGSYTVEEHCVFIFRHVAICFSKILLTADKMKCHNIIEHYNLKYWFLCSVFKMNGRILIKCCSHGLPWELWVELVCIIVSSLEFGLSGSGHGPLLNPSRHDHADLLAWKTKELCDQLSFSYFPSNCSVSWSSNTDRQISGSQRGVTGDEFFCDVTQCPVCEMCISSGSGSPAMYVRAVKYCTATCTQWHSVKSEKNWIIITPSL
jgi:hypothetical protein